MPFLDGLLAGDGVDNRVMPLDMDEPLDAVFPAEFAPRALAVLHYPLSDVSAHTSIERPVLAIGQDIDITTGIRRPPEMGPRFRGDDGDEEPPAYPSSARASMSRITLSAPRSTGDPGTGTGAAGTSGATAGAGDGVAAPPRASTASSFCTPRIV